MLDDWETPPSFTRKQREVIELLGEGLTSKEIAARLGVSPAAVDQRISWAIKKCQVENRRALTQLFSHSRRLNSEPPQLTAALGDAETSTSEQSTRWMIPEAPQPHRRRANLRLKLDANYVEIMVVLAALLVLTNYLG